MIANNAAFCRISLALTLAIFFALMDGPAFGQIAVRAPSQMKGCTSLLRLAEAEYKAVDVDMERLKKLKAERGSVLTSKSVELSPSGQSGQLAAPQPTETTELANLYDSQMGSIEKRVQSRRVTLAAIAKVYRECIKTPPKAKAEAASERAPKKSRK
jgi:hypothetical protein